MGQCESSRRGDCENELFHEFGYPPGMHYEPVTGPAAWYGRELVSRGDWIRQFTAGEIDEVRGAVDAFKNKNQPLSEISRQSFALPTLGEVMRETLAELLEGRGFILMRGLPVERWTREEQAIAYMGL